MSVFLYFLLILFIVTIIVPIVRVWQFVRRVKSSQIRCSTKCGAQPVKRKKIAADVGEYVEFQEVAVSVKVTDENGDTSEIYESESRIVDVEWEDLPPLPEK